jgi:hypothetical protein
MESIFSNLPNDIIINILKERKELKRNDRFKNQFTKVLSDIKYYGEKKEIYKRATFIQTIRFMGDNSNGVKKVTSSVLKYWSIGVNKYDKEHIEFDDHIWEIVHNMSKHLARVGIRSQEANLMELWEDYMDDDFDEEDPYLLCIYKLYPEWGVRYLGQDKSDPWLPCDNGYFK